MKFYLFMHVNHLVYRQCILTSIGILWFQEQAHDAKLQATSPEDTEDLFPLPAQGQQPARRRGGISAEPVSEEDATSYVKKVNP